MSKERQIDIPVVRTLPQAEAVAYWKELQERNLRYNYGGKRPDGEPQEMHYGAPVEISERTAAEIAGAAEASWEIVREGIREKGGLTEWIQGHAPHVGGVPLNNREINAQMERAIAAGYRPPMIYDVIFAIEGGVPIPKVVEIQTGIGYSGMHIAQLEAAGFNSDDPNVYAGKKNPKQVFAELKEEIAGGKDIIVMDTDPLHGGSVVDQVGMAKILGNERSMPASPLDIQEGEDENGTYWFYYQPAVDPETGFPAEYEHGTIIRTDEEIRIEAVLARMIQGDLDELDKRLADNPAQRDRVIRFLNDPKITWIQHPTWQYIIDKSTLSYIRQRLTAAGSPYADQFVPVYNAGETVTNTQPGGRKEHYVRKPTDGVSGGGQSEVVLQPGEIVIVEPGQVMQKKFVPYPVPVVLPDGLENAYPIPADVPPHLSEHFGWNTGEITPGTQELRFMTPPLCKDDDGFSGWFLGRLAPRWNNPAVDRTPTKTNQGKIQDAMWRSDKLNGENWMQMPFGWNPVVVRR